LLTHTVVKVQPLACCLETHYALLASSCEPTSVSQRCALKSIPWVSYKALALKGPWKSLNAFSIRVTVQVITRWQSWEKWKLSVSTVNGLIQYFNIKDWHCEHVTIDFVNGILSDVKWKFFTNLLSNNFPGSYVYITEWEDMEWTKVGMNQGPIPEFILREWVKIWKSSGTSEPRIKPGTCRTLSRSSD